jgi:hypothetical protein
MARRENAFKVTKFDDSTSESFSTVEAAMKKILVLCGALLALSATASFAQVDLTWNDCVLEGSVQDVNYTNCSTALKTIKMYGSFKVPAPLPLFVAADVSMDLQEEGVATLDKFWRYDAVADGGCNSAGIAIKIDADLNGFCGGEANPWGPGGSNAQAFFVNFLNGQGGPNRARLLFSVARASNDPQPLDPLTNYYMADFDFNTSQRATCPGCTGKVAIVWNSSLLYQNDGNTTVLSGADKLGNCAKINHSAQTTCDATPTKKSSWGQLKSLYR